VGEVVFEFKDRRLVLRNLLVVGEQLGVKLPFPLQIVGFLQCDIGGLRRRARRWIVVSASARAICASRLAICKVSALTSAAVKVGSSVARRRPPFTSSPSCTSRVLMIEGSSA